MRPGRPRKEPAGRAAILAYLTVHRDETVALWRLTLSCDLGETTAQLIVA